MDGSGDAQYPKEVSDPGLPLDLADIEFVLFDQLRVHERLADLPRYTDFDRDVYAATLAEGAKVATDVLHPINAPGDRQGCRLEDDGTVRTPDGYPEAWKAFAAGGWIAPHADAELGGAGMPMAIGLALNEMFSGACMAFMMYPGLSAAAARVIAGFGPEATKRQIAEKLFTGEWGGTMCLTESGAGSSVGDNRCRARATAESGVYELEGEKIFISGGDQDLVGNIAHLVLARTEDAPAGTKGLSLFLVPKFWFDDDLTLGERNGARVLGIEHKMGINGSATCTLGLGTDGPCRGWLVGNESDGMRLMFHMMNEARIGVGVQGLATAAVAYNHAVAYAKERVQGTSLRDYKNPDAQNVAIVQHPDVRRMLMTQKVLVESMRALCYRLAVEHDLAEYAADEAERKRWSGRVDLLVPVVKAICTDLGFDVCVSAVQVFGGYGYISEYPVEQLVRDAKIQSIYEGTNGIQALDLLARKLRIDGGRLLMEWMQDAQQRAEAGKAAGFSDDAAALTKAVQAVGASAMHLGGQAQKGEVEGAMLQAVPFLRAFGLVVLGLECMEQAVLAHGAIESGRDDALLRGKSLNLRFYVHQILPGAIALAKSIQSGDVSCLDPQLWAQ
ncbi:MAG: acyl-CoA dehydrogenase [Myxococcales bacterium FL481]|nr:MAG: acyl-CoA dehydrogenase [Myxococcales bacterium FL481]